ncbi:CpsD/CapB family tyrosine-protein kinase [Microbaculum sp. FT89]|uniref:CpsD/CapB family tyrosine-protein kinase n=1 Tax=Microbaculum sp. FT89 TaxID=3447298 RepID=UPI003F53CD38
MEHVRAIAPLQIAEPGDLGTVHGRSGPVKWPGLKRFKPDFSALRDNRIVTGSRFEPANAAFEVLRTKVLRLMREYGWRSIIVTSPTAGCGKSVVTINLAFSMARMADRHVALLDLDLRRPSMAKYLKLEAPVPMEKFLSGAATVEDIFVSWQDALAIAATESMVADPTGLLQSPSARAAIARVHEELQPDVIVCDMPPVFDSGDVLAFASNVDCVLLVAAAGKTKVSEIEACERELAAFTNVLGVVLNKCEYMAHKGGY